MTDEPEKGDAVAISTQWECVQLDVTDGIAWVTLNRPDKRNAMNPKLNAEMREVLDAVDADPEAAVLVLTGAGEAFSAGVDLKEDFPEVHEQPPPVQRQGRRGPMGRPGGAPRQHPHTTPRPVHRGGV